MTKNAGGLRNYLQMPKEKTISELKKLKDKNINFNDISELGSEFWENAEWVEPDITQSLNIRIKKSVLDYFKKGGKGYQTRINAVLESYVRSKTHLKSSQ